MDMGEGRAYQVVAMGAMALILGLTVGYFAGQEGWLAEQPEPEQPAVEAPQPIEAQASAAERFEVFTVNIFECGHILERDEQRAVTGPEAESTMRELEGYTYELKDGRMALYREFEYCCPEHYYTGLEGSEAAVYNTDASTLERTLVCTLALEEGTPAYDEIGSGMTFGSLEDVNLYLEGLDE